MNFNHPIFSRSWIRWHTYPVIFIAIFSVINNHFFFDRFFAVKAWNNFRFSPIIMYSQSFSSTSVMVRVTRLERAQSASQMLGSTIKLHPDIGAFQPHANRSSTGATALHCRQAFTAARSRRLGKRGFWWAFTASNRGPIRYERMALTN